MNRFRSRLLFSFITLIIIVLIGLGLLLGHTFKGFYVDIFNKQMNREINFIATNLKSTNINDISAINEIKKLEPNLSGEVTLFDGDRHLVYATNKDSFLGGSEELDTLFDRAKSNKDEIVFTSKDEQEYHYGMYFEDKNKTVSYLIISVSISELGSINEQIWGLLVISLSVAFIVILFLGFKITAQYTKPIESVTYVAIELAKGNYKARTYENHVDETGMLSESINVLARNLEEMKKNDEMQQDRLRTLIENVGSGIILIDGRGYITLINKTYREIFHVEEDQYTNHLFYEFIPYQEIIEFVEEILLSETQVRKQMMLPLGIERKHFEIYGAPIIGTNHEWKGIVLVFHDITELKKLEQVRKDFLANVSHELKTPITSIKGFSETLLDGAMEDEHLRQYFLSIILKESNRMQSLIQDLLELSKIEQQGFNLNVGKVNLQELLGEIVVLLHGKAQDKSIELQLNVLEKIEVVGDALRIKQVFLNLVNNAISYTPAEGQITLAMKDCGDTVEISVADKGIGINPEELPRIFERFYRVDKARSRNSGGTGLGLAIVKHLVEAHHGRIEVDSIVGEGTTFTVILKKEWDFTIS